MFNILISSDNHLGYKENDAVIGDDSFRVFEEVLETANELDVDFLLLGGDLFHENRPSQSTYYKASEIFNKHVFGAPSPNKMNSMIGNNQSRVSFETRNYPNANYMNHNHKVKMPIFSIHGNHDSPIGLDLMSSMDQLNANSYVNYFGKVPDIQNLEVNPVLLVKGRTRIAIYGIGHISDIRFNVLNESGNL